MRTLLPVTIASYSGVDIKLTQADQTNGNCFVNDGKTVILVSNKTAGTLHVTFPTVEFDEGGSLISRTIALAANQSYAVGPFPVQMFKMFPVEMPGDCVWVDADGDLGFLVLSLQ